MTAPCARAVARRLSGVILALLCSAACDGSGREGHARQLTLAAAAREAEFASAPDSAWVAVYGPTLVAFHPVVSNDSLAADPALAAALDDLSYHIGTAMDSLNAAGFTVHYRGGDTLWVRTGGVRTRIVRSRDSATVGYLFADAMGHQVVIYGVRGYTDLVAYAHEFKRTGMLKAK